MKRFIALTLLLLGSCGTPALFSAEPQILIDALPTGGMFFGATPVGLPFKDAASANPKEIEEGLNGALASMIPGAKQRGLSFICLLSVPGEQPVEIPIVAAKKNLKLSRTNTSLLALFFTSGQAPSGRVTYALGSPEPGKPQASVTMRKVAVPQGVTTAGWVYYNLTRLQADVEKAGASLLLLAAAGSGPKTPVPIPGLKEPLLVPEENTSLTATWAMPAGADPAHPVEILGHKVDKDAAKLDSK